MGPDRCEAGLCSLGEGIGRGWDGVGMGLKVKGSRASFPAEPHSHNLKLKAFSNFEKRKEKDSVDRSLKLT